MSPRLILNYLIPWRRRRRYYFLCTLARLTDLEISRSEWPAIFAVTPEQFGEFLSGHQVPRLFVQSLAIMAYKVPPPSRLYVYAPAVLLCNAAIAIAFFSLR
jgi:hypothetical protein